ncbi:hypothetical protein D7V21_04660 [Acinetobacter guerrae]|uniref:Uncharacterized protein n=1 Tax=Acinetobacter guerrae TaxID=1843371 RepID=A0A3A8F1Q7_9GAMM|nr:hypothetical protein [Acinetobacter guerrae]RKG35081.1 hypothetical protein D7V21_04660 [Acinetobacter guerrae]
MRIKIARWTTIDRLVFAGCYGSLGLLLGLAAAVFVSKYVDTKFDSATVIVFTGLICVTTAFIAPNMMSLCFRKLWLWIKYWWS